MLKWIEAFLSDRTQNVSVNGILSLCPGQLFLESLKVMFWALCYFFYLLMTFLHLSSQIYACLRTTVPYTESGVAALQDC